MSDYDLIKIDDDALEAAVSKLNRYIAELEDENISLGYIANNVRSNWNDGLTEDVNSYLTVLSNNREAIDKQIIPTLHDYCNTMITLIQQIREAERRVMEEIRARKDAALNGNQYEIR